MAHIRGDLDRLPEKEYNNGDSVPFKRRYHWSQWFDGNVWELLEGLDYSERHKFQAAVSQEAKRRGLYVETRGGGNNSLLIQCLGRRPEHPSNPGRRS